MTFIVDSKGVVVTDQNDENIVLDEELEDESLDGDEDE